MEVSTKRRLGLEEARGRCSRKVPSKRLSGWTPVCPFAVMSSTALRTESALALTTTPDDFLIAAAFTCWDCSCTLVSHSIS